MTVFNIRDICKEIQRIREDILEEQYNEAIERCDGLDDLLCGIEYGKHQLIAEGGVIEKVNYGELKPLFTTLERVEPNDYSIWYKGKELPTGYVCYILNEFVDKIKELEQK